jgi:hypothetical protein
MQIKVPTSWNEIKTWKWLELVAIDPNDKYKASKTISILCDVPLDHVKNEMPFSVVEEITNQLNNITGLPEGSVNEFEWKGKIFRPVHPHKVSTGQMADIMAYKDDFFLNFSKLAACIFRAEDEVEYTGTSYEMEDMIDEQPISVTYPCVLFFSAFVTPYSSGMQDFLSNLSPMIIQAMEEMTLAKNGDGTDLYTGWLMEILQSSKQSQE